MPGGTYNEPKNTSNQVRRWRRRRFRDTICNLSPEVWLAISFTLLVLALSLLFVGYFLPDLSDVWRDLVLKFGGILLFFGWAAFVYLIETVRNRDGSEHRFVRGPNPPFVGISIPPPPQEEFLSAMLLPNIERGWVPTENEPWFEPSELEMLREFESFRPQVTEEGEDSRLSASKKKRIRKRKTSSQISDETEHSNESPGQQNESYQTFEEATKESNLTSTKRNISNLFSGGKKPEHSRHTSTHPENSNRTSLGDIPEKTHETSGQSKDSNQACGDNREQSVQNIEQSTEQEKNPDGKQPVGSKLASSSQPPKPKKRNRKSKD